MTNETWDALPHAPATGTQLCRFDEVPDGAAHFVTLGSEDSPFRVILLRSADSVFAYVNRCAHFGVPLAQRIEQLRFKPHLSVSCNVHYARFRWQDGFCEFGDCEGESLIPIPVEVVSGVVQIVT